MDTAKEHWVLYGKGSIVFTVLPFGLSLACYIFTKILRPVVHYWRAKGLRALVYLDDGLCVVEGRQNAEAATEHSYATT